MDEPIPMPPEQRLAGITEENRHGEWDTGEDGGGELWQGMAWVPEQGATASLLLTRL